MNNGQILLNGALRLPPTGADGHCSVADVVPLVAADAGGVAVAVNGAVVPRSAWKSTSLTAGDRVEVVTAVQGG